MMIFIGIEEVLDNAFITYSSKTNERVLSIEKILKYAKSVVEALSKENVQAILLFSEKGIYEYLEKYSKLYKLIKLKDGTRLIQLNDDASIEELIKKYSEYPIKELVDYLNREDNVSELF